jgi:hypothetical protein
LENLKPELETALEREFGESGTVEFDVEEKGTVEETGSNRSSGFGLSFSYSGFGIGAKASRGGYSYSQRFDKVLEGIEKSHGAGFERIEKTEQFRLSSITAAKLKKIDSESSDVFRDVKTIELGAQTAFLPEMVVNAHMRLDDATLKNATQQLKESAVHHERSARAELNRLRIDNEKLDIKLDAFRRELRRARQVELDIQNLSHAILSANVDILNRLPKETANTLKQESFGPQDHEDSERASRISELPELYAMPEHVIEALERLIQRDPVGAGRLIKEEATRVAEELLEIEQRDAELSQVRTELEGLTTMYLL